MAVTDITNASPDTSGLHAWQRLWRGLDKFYEYTGYLAAFCIMLIFAITMFQVIGRYVGYNPAGLPNYVGYLTGATTFLALAHTLNKGAHVRVNLFLSLVGRLRPFVEAVGLMVSIVVGVWFSWYCWLTVYDSYRFGDISEGLDATPIWLPQLSMAIGASVLAVALCDHFTRLLVTGDTGIVSLDEPV